MGLGKVYGSNPVEVRHEIEKAPYTREGSLELLDFARICFWYNEPEAGAAILQEVCRREVKKDSMDDDLKKAT